MPANLVLDAMLRYINKNNWAGACFASSAIMHILLSELDVKSDLCLGVLSARVTNDNGDEEVFSFDHGWLGINDSVYDVAITRGISLNFGPDLVPSNGNRGQHHACFIYGANFLLDQKNIDELIPFEKFMLNAPFFDKSINYWDITCIVGKEIDLRLCSIDLFNKYRHTSWLHTLAQT